MFDKALDAMRAALNAALKAQLELPDDQSVVVLAALSDRDTAGAEELASKLCLTLVNIERESAAQSGTQRRAGDEIVRNSAPLHLNLYVLLSSVPAGAQPSSYPAALTRLAKAMEILQARPTMTPQNTPDLPPGLDRLTIELVSLDLQNLNHLWGNLGGRFLPSALYKLRMVTLQADEPQPEGPAITRIGGRMRG